MPESVKNFFDSLWVMPADFWVKIFAVIVVLFVLSVAFKRIIQLSQVVFVVALLAVAGVIFVKWVRDRNEPPFMTPVVNFVASFFPPSSSARQR
jgi:hypothetical protein